LIADELAPQRPTRETTDGLALASTCGSPQPDPWRPQRLGRPSRNPHRRRRWRYPQGKRRSAGPALWTHRFSPPSAPTGRLPPKSAIGGP